MKKSPTYAILSIINLVAGSIAATIGGHMDAAIYFGVIAIFMLLVHIDDQSDPDHVEGPLHWELIENKETIYMLFRAKVPGGWLICSSDDVLEKIKEGEHFNRLEWEMGHRWRTSLTFVPDPKHEWKL